MTNRADRPIQVGSHYHFAETNRWLRFDRLAAYGRLGRHLALGTLYVVRTGFEALTLRDAIDCAIAPGIVVGASDLPNGAGAWLRVLGPDARSVTAVLRAAWATACRHILGAEPAIDRRP